MSGYERKRLSTTSQVLLIILVINDFDTRAHDGLNHLKSLCANEDDSVRLNK